jgi:multidrug efflux pump subunit AcrB
MNLTEFALRNNRFTYVVFFCIVALDLSAFLSIPRREDPSLKIPTTVVVAVFPGASAVEIERLVVRPLEDNIKELDDIRKLRATLENWRKILVPSVTGNYVPIDQMARLEFISVPPIIERFNRERSSIVTSWVRAGLNVGKVTAAVAGDIAPSNGRPGFAGPSPARSRARPKASAASAMCSWWPRLASSPFSSSSSKASAAPSSSPPSSRSASAAA